MQYQPLLRLANFSTLPPSLEWTYTEAPPDIAHMRPDIPASNHIYGIIETTRELTPWECDRFSLRPIA